MVKEADTELLRRIVYTKDVEDKGFRRIGRELDPPLSKDTVMRRYRKAKARKRIADVTKTLGS